LTGWLSGSDNLQETSSLHWNASFLFDQGIYFHPFGFHGLVTEVFTSLIKKNEGKREKGEGEGEERKKERKKEKERKRGTKTKKREAEKDKENGKKMGGKRSQNGSKVEGYPFLLPIMRSDIVKGIFLFVAHSLFSLSPLLLALFFFFFFFFRSLSLSFSFSSFFLPLSPSFSLFLPLPSSSSSFFFYSLQVLVRRTSDTNGFCEEILYFTR